MAFSGKVIVVTGAASGIGLATVEALAMEGATLAFSDIQQERLQEVSTKLKAQGVQHHATVLDVRDRSAVEEWIESTVDKYGPIDGAVHAAGVSGKEMLLRAVHEISEGDWNFVMGVNLLGTLHCLRAEIPSFRDGGSIVNVASVAGLEGAPKTAAYTVSKHAVIGLTRVTASELGARNIRVNAVCPGSINTAMMLNSPPGVAEAVRSMGKGCCLGRLGEPHEVASQITWLLSDKASYVNASLQIIDGGHSFH